MNNETALTAGDFQEIGGLLWMPIKDLARRLGYKSPRKLKHLYKRHEDELSQYARVSKMDTFGKMRETLALNELGCYTIAMFAQTDKAKIFRQQLAQILMQLRKGNIGLTNPKAQQLLDGYRMEYYRKEKDEFIRKRKDLNFTKAKAIDRMTGDGLDDLKITEYMDIRVETLKKYRELKTIVKNIEEEYRQKYGLDVFIGMSLDELNYKKQTGRLGDGYINN